MFEGITGIIEPASGDLWVNGRRGAVRVEAQDLDKAVLSGTYDVSAELFDEREGFPGVAQKHRPVPTAIEGTDGRLWFAGDEGLAFIDPARILRNVQSPPVVIRGLLANNSGRPTDRMVRLAEGTQSLQISYTALSFSKPEGVRFQYFLEGIDRAWVQAGRRRQAIYPNIGPGKYRFHVLAANENGIWNGAEATLDFLIPPTVWETRTFRIVCALLVIGLLWGAYKVRITQIQSRERLRLKARLAERERIARDLHDTPAAECRGSDTAISRCDQAIARGIAHTRDDGSRLEARRRGLRRGS